MNGVELHVLQDQSEGNSPEPDIDVHVTDDTKVTCNELEEEQLLNNESELQTSDSSGTKKKKRKVSTCILVCLYYLHMYCIHKL